jgi:hypothetical protein
LSDKDYHYQQFELILMNHPDFIHHLKGHVPRINVERAKKRVLEQLDNLDHKKESNHQESNFSH